VHGSLVQQAEDGELEHVRPLGHAEPPVLMTVPADISS
jgi:hypothetical protein